jgi:hypothetical protein
MTKPKRDVIDQENSEKNDKRFSVSFTGHYNKLIKLLAEEDDVSKNEALKKSVKIAYFLSEAQKNGGKLYIEELDGTRTAVVFV